MFGAGERAQEKTSRHLTSKKKGITLVEINKQIAFLLSDFSIIFCYNTFYPCQKYCNTNHELSKWVTLDDRT